MKRSGGRYFNGPPLPDLFPLGRLGITPAANDLIDDAALKRVIEWHASGWWCEPQDLLSRHDCEVNERVLADRASGEPCGEVLSKYRVTDRSGEAIELYVITSLAGAHSYTIVCLPEEK